MKFIFDNAGDSFAFALKSIYDGYRVKLERNDGQWSVTVNSTKKAV